MLYGMLFSVLAGIMVSMQGIFNARLSDKIGFWHTNTFVHGSGFLVAFIIMLMFENLNFSPIKEVQPYYLLGGVMGVVIIFSVINGISSIGASYTITLMIVTQIVFTAGINYFGYFGEPIILLSLRKAVGLVLMISGLVMYQMN
ncbi:DMT family transporter [Isachenkonia alkalipeptolytica]|uniref:DMT family transporter n=1 Tax=Isachenkonia alkalipeptolytica TaxID=2565777 RepID=A0AA44BCT4_9CLOT|nr:DMT family transporter [Isachenkonia alkalipeptolytica]NBG87629.1 DMT family transporter [Isachenkonia alkalipeptolytica]